MKNAFTITYEFENDKPGSLKGVATFQSLRHEDDEYICCPFDDSTIMTFSEAQNVMRTGIVNWLESAEE